MRDGTVGLRVFSVVSVFFVSLCVYGCFAMLSALIANSVRLRVVVLALSVVLLIVGSRSVRRAPLDVFPEFAPPLVEIQTEAPGLSTNEVESLVTVPVENALNGLPNVKTV